MEEETGVELELLGLEELLDSITQTPLPTSSSTPVQSTTPVQRTTPPKQTPTPKPTTPKPTTRTSPTSIRRPTREEVLRTTESLQVLQSGQDEWKLFFSQAKQVLTPGEQKTLKHKRRRALGVIYARKSRDRSRQARGREQSQFTQLTRHNQQLTETVAELSAANAELLSQLEELRNQLGRR